MAGANGVPKFEQVDRENEILQLKYVGPSSQTLNQYTIPSLGLFTGANPTNPNGYPTSWAAGILTQNWLITASTPNPLTGPTGAQAYTQFGASLGNANPVGQTYIQSVQNSTGAPVVINFASGFTPSTLTIPANTTEYLQWECTAPDTFVLFYESAFPPTAGGGTVTSITAGTGITLTPNPITTTGTVAITNTAVTPGTYTFMDATVNAQGQITAAGNGTLSGTGITVTPTGAFPTNGYNLSLANTTVTMGSYTWADITVNAAGQITSATNGTLTAQFGLSTNPIPATGTATIRKQTPYGYAQINAQTVASNGVVQLVNQQNNTVEPDVTVAGNIFTLNTIGLYRVTIDIQTLPVTGVLSNLFSLVNAAIPTQSFGNFGGVTASQTVNQNGEAVFNRLIAVNPAGLTLELINADAAGNSIGVPNPLALTGGANTPGHIYIERID